MVFKKQHEQTQFDREFFQKLEPRAHSKGSVSGYNRVSSGNSTDKPSKKHFNSKKKEKNRRLNSHLDN